jgi:diguanylate cyclase (GGDEF)-like protein/PAS domain S-box-containing protein
MPHPPRPEHLLAALLESAEDAILSFALDGTVQSWSQGAERLYGYNAEEIIGQPMARLLPLYEVPGLEALLVSPDFTKIVPRVIAERLEKNGTRLCVEVKRTTLLDETGTTAGIVETAKVMSRLGGSTPEATQFHLLMEQMPVMVWTTDQNLRITSNWGVQLEMCPIQPGDLTGKTIFEYMKSADRHSTPIAQHYEALRGTPSHFEYERENRVLDIQLQPLRSASKEIIGCIAVAQDITDRKKSEQQIRYQATHDALTGLANYREFIDTLEREVHRAERSHQSFTVLLLDMDELKKINDRLGHLAGNRALKRLAAILNEQCRSTDLAARYGGDEFAVVLIDSDQGMAEQVTRRIETSLRQDQEAPTLSVSIGIGVYPEDGRTIQELLEAADQQLYRRKKASRSQSMTAS